jgi:hypothetical protein
MGGPVRVLVTERHVEHTGEPTLRDLSWVSPATLATVAASTSRPGHLSPWASIALGIYSHVMPHMQQQAAEAMDQALGRRGNMHNNVYRAQRPESH